MQPMLNIALRAARLAGEHILRASERLDLIKSEQGNLREFINETATQAEMAIVHTIQKAYPQHLIECEFTGQHGEADEKNAEQVTWQVTPIDSLTNFSTGLPLHAICIAGSLKGKVQHAVILNPISGEEFTASRGYGAQFNGRRIRCSQQKGLEGAQFATSFISRKVDRENLTLLSTAMGSIAAANGILHNGGSAAMNLAYTAAGRFDGSFHRQLNPTVMAAALLLNQESGALLGDLSGGAHYRQSGDLLCANPKVFKALVQALRQSV